MKNKKLVFLSLAILVFSSLKAQVTPPQPKVYGASPFQDSLWSILANGVNWNVVDRLSPSLPGFTITGINGLAMDPCNLQMYSILKVSGVSGRVLATIDLETAVCTQVGNLGDNFSSIAFDRTGQLFGVTGDGASVPESFYAIDKANGTKTLLRALGNGADGEVICYNHATNMFYHWSGNGTVVFEKIRNTPPYDIFPIQTGGGFGETFGALNTGANEFILSNINSQFRIGDTLGTIGNSLISLPDDLRGLVLRPQFLATDDTICVDESITVHAAGISYFHKLYYNWGDGTIDTITNGSGATHTYVSNGNFTVNVQIDNGFCGPNTVFTHTLRVNALPVVAITGNTAICPGSSVILTGSSGGSSQWYFNGAPIGGANGNTYEAFNAGYYNMTKTNQNGCSDSSETGIVLIDVLNPVVNLGQDTTVCGSITLNASNPGSAYLWSDNSTGQTLNVTTSGVYNVAVTDTNACSSTDEIDITVNPNPTVTYSQGVSFICTYGGQITLSGGLPAGGAYAVNGVQAAIFDPSVVSPGVYNLQYTFTDANNCSVTATNPLEVSACVGISEDQTALSVSIFPNPVNDEFTVLTTNNSDEQKQLQVLDLTGKVLVSMAFYADNLQINIGHLAAGIYLVKLTESKGSKTFRIIKK